MSIYLVFLATTAVVLGTGMVSSLLEEAIVVLTATALSVASYRTRATAFRSRHRTQEVLDQLTRTQREFLIAKNASSQMRLAAALSHKLNTPIAALSSSLNTLLLAREKWQVNPGDCSRYEAAFKSALGTGLEATGRLKELVERTKRLTNLDRAEEQLIDMNAFVSDVVALSREHLLERVQVKLALGSTQRREVEEAGQAHDEGWTVLRSGVEPGEVVITGGFGGLEEGSRAVADESLVPSSSRVGS